MHKNSKIVLLTIIMVFVLVFCFGFYIKKNKYDSLANLSENSFDCSQSEYKNGLLISNNQFIYVANNGCIQYTNIKSGMATPLCRVSGCAHNTDDCEAIFGFDFSAKIVTVKSEKLLVIGNTYKGIRVYCSNIDGTDHELLLEHDFSDDKYNEIGDVDFYVGDSYILVAVSMWNTVDQKVLDDGSVSDAQSIVKIYKYDIEKNDIEKIYETQNPLYQSYAEFRYVDDNVVYYDYTGSNHPYEEIYNFETGELKDPNVPDDGPMEVHSLNLETGEEDIVRDQVFGDYIGKKGDNYFYYEYGKEGLLTGNLIIRNKKECDFKKMYIDIIKGKNRDDCQVNLLESGFVVNIQEVDDESGKMILYDNQGNIVNQINDCVWFINGEYGDYYLFGDSNISQYSSAFIKKSDIESMKVIELEAGL